MNYTGPHIGEEPAERHSRGIMQVLCAQRGQPYPLPPGQSTGGRPLADPSVAYATHAVPWRQDTGGLFWLRLTDEIGALPAQAASVIVDAVKVVVARSGVVKPDTDFEIPSPQAASNVRRP